MNPDTCRGGVRPHKKRQYPLETELVMKPDACIVCQVSDERVSSCSGVDCLLRFHGECLTPEVGGSEDLSNPFCPYCWLKVVSLESNLLREEAVRAEKAVCKYLDKDIEESDQGVQGEPVVYSPKQDHFDKDSHQPEDEGTGMEEEGTDMEEDNGIEEDDIEASSEDEEQDAATNVAAQQNTFRNSSFFDKGHRRKILWTPKEEEMLRMGVKRFLAEIHKNMPWRKILQMGRDVFHETRTPAHLKDKWRCMTKPQQ